VPTVPVGPGRITPAPQAITLPTTFTVTGTCTGVTALSSARVVFLRPGATTTAAPTEAFTATGTVTGQSFTVPVSLANLTAAQRAQLTQGGIWAVELIGTAVGGASRTFLTTFVPPDTSSTITVNCSNAETVATSLVLQAVTPSFVLTRAFETTLSGLSLSAAAFVPVDFAPTGNAVTLLQGLADDDLVDVDSVRFVGLPVSPFFVGESVIVTAEAVRDGDVVEVPVRIAVESGAANVSLVPFGNQAWLQAGNPGTFTLRATVVGTSPAVTALSPVITIQLHPQGHAQGNGVGS